ncbi:caveolin-3-like [Saccostrea echinata]|uniref:caveolin-3-like n=1 Tax=Saccostrea echinata TaxID=191078 RepID=UPI002A829EBC|nr:caveolin-3-like [Saccostrea echinata]
MSQQTKELDMVDRDPNQINSHVKVAFEDVLAEPDGAHSIDCVWNLSYFCFNCGKNCCYKFMTTLCGIFIALYWGCEFACITFDQVWCITPSLRIFSIYMGCAQKYFGTCVSCCLAPICETSGLFFSSITVKNT